MSSTHTAAPRPDVDHAIASIAASQHGIVTSAQLRLCGLSTSAIAKRARSGRLHRVHPSTYAVGHAGLSHMSLMSAAVLAAGDGAAVAGLCAARLWRISRWPATAIEIVSPRRHRGLDGVVVHWSRRLHGSDLSRVERIAITNPTRTIVDIADRLDPHPLAYVLHQARYRRLLRLRELERMAHDLRARHGHPALVEAIRLHRSGSAGTRSQREDAFLRLLRGACLPEPLVNVRVEIAGGSIEVDFHWPEARLCVEVDGPGHDLPAQRHRDAAHDAALRVAGWTVLRVPHDWLDAGVRTTSDLLQAA